MNRKDLSLYLVTDRSLCNGRDIEDLVLEAVKGGVTIVQLREKNTPTAEFVALAGRMKSALKPFGVPLIINDRIDVVLAADADGVHIGQSDMPYSIARKILGPDKIIGLSIENTDQLKEAESLDVDYIAASPVFATPTKTDTAAPWGMEGLKKMVEYSRHPVVAIGGINKKTAPEVIGTGVDGIAVVSAIISSDNPEEAARELKTLLR